MRKYWVHPWFFIARELDQNRERCVSFEGWTGSGMLYCRNVRSSIAETCRRV
jgi:hypothetical protein